MDRTQHISYWNSQDVDCHAGSCCDQHNVSIDRIVWVDDPENSKVNKNTSDHPNDQYRYYCPNNLYTQNIYYYTQYTEFKTCQDSIGIHFITSKVKACVYNYTLKHAKLPIMGLTQLSISWSIIAHVIYGMPLQTKIP